MAIPEEIRKVPRPKNTIVVENKNGKRYRYSVIERIGCEYRNGKNIPINGKTIGHIIDNTYVPKNPKLSERPISLKKWAGYELCATVGESLIQELREVYDVKDADKIFTIALTRVINRDCPDYMIQHHYEESWLSELYPGVSLSKNVISKFLKSIGNDYAGITTFMTNRVSKVEKDQHIAIDGMLKSYTSDDNSLSQYSRKARIKGCQDISVVFAYNIETCEPICSKVFAGNIVDSTAYDSFLKDNGIEKGLILTDKGFPPKKVREYFAEKEDLRFLTPLKRDDKRIEENDLYSYSGVINDADKDVQYKKVKVDDKTIFYSFYNRKLAAKEEHDFFERNKDKEYDSSEWKKAKERFGTIVFESNYDTSCEVIYKAYNERWLVEEFFRAYKHITEFTDGREHSDAAIIGSEFVNFISSVITSKLINVFDKTELLKEYTYREIMEFLNSAYKYKTSEKSGWKTAALTAKNTSVLERLGLADPATKSPAAKSENEAGGVEKKKRGRPKGSKNKPKESN